MPTQNASDSDALYSENPSEQVAQPLKRAIAFYLSKSLSDFNQQPPTKQIDAFGKRFFEAAPVQLKRLFNTPLVLGGGRGPNGPNGERLVTSGWGDSRSVGVFESVKYGTRVHKGLDFRAPTGETVLACADGRVTRVGFSHRTKGYVFVSHPKADAQGNIINADDGSIVALVSDLGHAGIYISVEHDGDFAGYVTEYMHLSEATVKLGARVLEGDVLGKVGTTGGDRGITSGPHLHWQVTFRNTAVNPTFLVPHYHPKVVTVKVDGSFDSSATIAMANVNSSKTMSVGEALVHNVVAGATQWLERQTIAGNVSSADVKTQQGNHAQAVAKSLNLHVSALYESVAKFQAAQPRIENGMYFNFDTGLWSDQTSSPGAGEGL